MDFVTLAGVAGSILSPKNKKYSGYLGDCFTWDWKVYLGMDTNFFLSHGHVVIAFVRIKCFSDSIFRSIASFVLPVMLYVDFFYVGQYFVS